MKRVLFVDDEHEILAGLRNILRKHKNTIDMCFALGGDAALVEMQRAPADVVVSDMRMPGMDGVALLAAIKEKYPATVRIILSGQAESESVFRSLPIAHQFLSKPCDAEKLYNVLMRACQLQTLLDNESMQAVLGTIDRLPSLPNAYWDLMQAFAGNDIPVRKIADIIETDSAMCGKILQLVNSSCFGTYKTISKIDHAVAYLGTDLIKELTLTANVFVAMEKVPSFEGFSFQAAQAHAVLTARIAKCLASDPQQTSNAFTAALLHDIGYSVFSSCDQERFRTVLRICAETGRPDFEVEPEVFGVTHAEAGAYLLGLWGLPFPLIEAVAYHHRPEASGEQRFDLPSIVGVADAFAHMATNKDFDSPLPEALMTHLEALGVASKVDGWKKIAFSEIDNKEGTLQSGPH